MSRFMKRKIIDAALNELTGSYESYNPDIDKHLNENDFSHYSLEELTLKQDQYFKNADRLYAIMDKIKKEGKVNKFVGLEAASICKEMNINVGLEEYTVSNESVNIPLIAMIAGAILVVAAIIAKIWGIITGGGSGDSGGGGGGGSPEVKKEAINTAIKVTEVTQESNPKVKDAVTQTDSIYASAMNEIRTKKLEELKKYSAYPTLFDYLDNLPEDGENFGIPAILNGLKTSANLVPRLLFSELSNDFFGRFKTVFDKTIEIKKQIVPIYTAIDESILTMNTAFWDAISSHKDGPGKALEAIDKAIASLTNLTVEEELITQITDARNAIEEEGFHGDLPEMKTVNSAILFNYFGSPLAKQCAEVIKEYDAFNASIFDKISSLPKELKGLNDDIVQLENNFKKDDITEFYKTYPEVEGKVNTYLDLVKTSTRTLGNISSIVAKAIVQAQNFADGYFKLESAINHFTDVVPSALKDLRRKLNDYGDDATSKIKELVSSVDKLILLIKERNISIKDVIGDVGKFKGLDNKDVFKSYLTYNANIMTKFLEKDSPKFKTDEAGMEKYEQPKVTYLPTVENYTFSQETYSVNGYKVTDLNGIKVNKMYTGVNTTSLENFIIETNLYNEIEIEQKASLENYFNSFEIDSQNLDNYFSKVDQLMSINNRIRNSGGITKSLGLEAIEVCSDLNIDIKKLSTYPSKIGYSASLEAIGVGVFALIIAAVVAVSMVLKKIWNFLMSDSGSGGGGGGSDFGNPAAIEKKIEGNELTVKVDDQIKENKEVVEEKIEQVGEAIKDTAKDTTVKEVIATIEDDLSPLVKYVMMDSGHNNIFELLDALPKEDFAYGPLVSVREQINNLKSFEKDIILGSVNKVFAPSVYGLLEQVIVQVPEETMQASKLVKLFTTFEAAIIAMIDEKIPEDERRDFFFQTTQLSNDEKPLKFSTDSDETSQKHYAPIMDYLNSTTNDNVDVGIIAVYSYNCGLMSEELPYKEHVALIIDALDNIKQNDLVNIINKCVELVNEKLNSIRDKLKSAGLFDESTNKGDVPDYIQVILGYNTSIKMLQNFLVHIAKTMIILEKISESKLKINIIIETYLKAATGQLVEFKKRLVSDINRADKSKVDNDEFKNKIDILYKQIDSLVEVVNGTNGDIKSIIESDPNYKDLMDNDDTSNKFVERILRISKTTIVAPNPSNETFDIVLRSNYSVMKYSLEEHSSGFVAIIAAGLVVVISVISLLIKKLFGGSSDKGSDTQSSSKVITTHSSIFGTVSDTTAKAAEHAEFDFYLSGLDFTKMTKPAEMPEDVYENTQQLANVVKRNGDRDIFKTIESMMQDENGKIPNKIMAFFERVKTITSVNRTLFEGAIINKSLSSMLDEIRAIKRENQEIYRNSVLDDVVSLLGKKDITEKEILDVNEKLNNAVARMSNAPKFLELMMGYSKNYATETPEISVEVFFENAIKTIKDKKAITILNDYYASCSSLQETLTKFSSELKAQQIKVNNFMDMAFEFPEAIREFKDKYRDYITAATTMQKTSYLLIENAVTLLREYESIFVAFFNVTMVAQSLIFYLLLRFKEVGVDVVKQLQNISKSNKEFLNYSKSISEGINDEIKKDSDTPFVIFKTRDRSLWNNVTNELQNLNDELTKYTSKMVPKPSNEAFDIALRNDYAVVEYSLESHNAGYMAIIITGVVFVISVLSAILKKLFGGSSKDSSGGSTASASKAVKTNKYINELYSDVNPVSDFNFGLNKLDYSRLSKPTNWTDSKFGLVKTTAEILKSSGDRGIFAVSETYINIAEDSAVGKDKAVYIENKINALGTTVTTMIYSKTATPALTNVCNAAGPLFSKASEYCFTRNKTKELFDLVFNKEMTAEIIDKAIKIIKDDLSTLQTLKVDLENQIDNLAYHEEMEIHAKFSLDDFMKGAHSALSDKGFQNAMASVGNHMADYAAKNQEFITDSEQIAKKIENEKETINDSDELADKNEEFKALNKEYTQLTIDIGKLCAKIMVSLMKFTQAAITITSYYADVSSQILQLLIILLSDLQKCNIDVGSQAEAILKTTNKYIDRLERQKDSLKAIISNNKHTDESMWFKNYGSLDNYTAKVLGGMNNAKKIAQEVIDNDIG